MKETNTLLISIIDSKVSSLSIELNDDKDL